MWRKTPRGRMELPRTPRKFHVLANDLMTRRELPECPKVES